MATTHDRTALLALRARIDERFIAPFKRNGFAHRTWFLAAVAFACAVHAGVLGYFLYRDWMQPPEAAKEQETPVEVVVRSPPPPQAQKPRQEIEKPASSAPRAASDTRITTDKTDKETRAPKAETPPADGDPPPSKDAAQTKTDRSDVAAAAAAVETPDVQKEAEALDRAAPKPEPEKPKFDTPRSAKTKMAAKPRHSTPASRQLAGLSDLPDYRFAEPTKRSPISGGTEDARYLAIVYGMIWSQIHFGGEGVVTVAFDLDDSGGVLDIGLLASSGDQMADAEAIDAVRRSSPFPPPLPGRLHSLRATIDFSRHPISMGAR